MYIDLLILIVIFFNLSSNHWLGSITPRYFWLLRLDFWFTKAIGCLGLSLSLNYFKYVEIKCNPNVERNWRKQGGILNDITAVSHHRIFMLLLYTMVTSKINSCFSTWCRIEMRQSRRNKTLKARKLLIKGITLSSPFFRFDNLIVWSRSFMWLFIGN